MEAALVQAGGHATPFHAGECAVQERVGVRERLAQIGPRVIRDFMPEQHREFFEQLPFLVAGAVDGAGQSWASVLAGPPGFIVSPDPQRLLVHARPPAHDPLAALLVPGAPVGLLGIEPHTRRRNRMNGVVERAGTASFGVQVQQSFGNCPKYIRPRQAYFAGAARGETTVHESAGLDAPARRIVQQADTLFIATAHPTPDAHTPSAQGVDVSHRGGPPGFVRIEEDGSLMVPDYLGNFFFNTLGNLALEPRCGLLFLDFQSGTRLHLAAHAEIVWDGPQLEAFEGAQRLLRIHVTAARRLEGGLPLHWAG